MFRREERGQRGIVGRRRCTSAWSNARLYDTRCRRRRNTRRGLAKGGNPGARQRLFDLANEFTKRKKGTTAAWATLASCTADLDDGLRVNAKRFGNGAHAKAALGDKDLVAHEAECRVYSK